jgi:glycolate oxidase FAD binding subunit
MRPTKISELQELVRAHSKLSTSGGKTKSALHNTRDEVKNLDLSGIDGIIEYNPSEFTITAQAGTKLEQLSQLLGNHEQYLPFDPPFIEQGATVGGTVASGVSGPGRFRYGGIRDFIIGIAYIDGQGKRVNSGGKVVKNAAGFDLSKLMVGSLGRYGALVECSFKVFPKPKVLKTIRVGFSSMEEALERLISITRMPIDLYALDIIPRAQQYLLLLRMGGVQESLLDRFDRLKRVVGDGEVIEGEEEIKIWRDIANFTWLQSGELLVKIPVTPKRVDELDIFLSGSSVKRHYSVGCNVAWTAWRKPVEDLDVQLNRLGLSGLVLVGEVEKIHLGLNKGNQFSSAVKEALDPGDRWVEV